MVRDGAPTCWCVLALCTPKAAVLLPSAWLSPAAGKAGGGGGVVLFVLMPWVCGRVIGWCMPPWANGLVASPWYAVAAVLAELVAPWLASCVGTDCAAAAEHGSLLRLRQLQGVVDVLPVVSLVSLAILGLVAAVVALPVRLPPSSAWPVAVLVAAAVAGA